MVNTFIGRDHGHPLEHSWDLFRSVWPDVVAHAERHRIKLGIENCPMLFTRDEWPGGKNLAVSPTVWRQVFAEIPSPNLGLNLDPSHLVWLHIDYVRCVREFGPRIVHVHAKDTRIDADQLYEVGVLGLGWHTPKLPGLGDVRWGPFFSALTDVGYQGRLRGSGGPRLRGLPGHPPTRPPPVPPLPRTVPRLKERPRREEQRN